MTSRDKDENGESKESAKGKELSLDAIDSGVALVEAKSEPDSLDRFEKEDVEDERNRLHLRLYKSRIKNLKADRKLRQIYASRILRFLEWYALASLALVVMQGFGIFGFHLDMEVVLAIVGSTAVAAIGLVGFIAKGLFPPNQS